MRRLRTCGCSVRVRARCARWASTSLSPPPPVARFNSLSPPCAPAVGGTTVLIAGSGFPACDSVTVRLACGSAAPVDVAAVGEGGGQISFIVPDARVADDDGKCARTRGEGGRLSVALACAHRCTWVHRRITWFAGAVAEGARTWSLSASFDGVSFYATGLEFATYCGTLHADAALNRYAVVAGGTLVTVRHSGWIVPSAAMTLRLANDCFEAVRARALGGGGAVDVCFRRDCSRYL